MGRTLAKKGGSAKKKGGHEEWMDDEIDDANRLRSKDKIGFDASDSEEEDPDAHMDTEGVMGIGADDSEDDSDLDSDEEEEEEDGEEDEDEDDDDDDDDDDLGSDEDEDEAALIRAMKAQQKKLASKGVKRADQDDSSSDEEEESEDDGLRIKGRKKSDFYGDEEVDHEGMSDEDERRDEEREARRLQQARAAGMSAADFGLSDEDDSDADESDSEPEEEATLGAKAAKLSAKGKKAEKESLKKKSKKSASLGAAVESLGGDELKAADGADAETGESPEVTALAKELTKNLDEVRNTIEPLCRYVREGNMVTKEGISYLDTKHLLMLSYCVNITFYMLLKAEGKPVKDHPVVLRLVEIRTYLEKLRPIDKKLKYQIDKLLKMAKDGVDGEEEDPTANGAGEDPLQFRPNPDALVSKVDEDAEEGAEGGVYRPPKMMPTAMEEFEEGGKSSKQKRAEKEARRRAQRSSLIKELAQELGEAPEELGGDEGDMQSAFAKREFARMEARAKIEEDMFTRVPLSKTERRRQKATTRSVNSLSQVGDFGDDVADLVEVAEELETKKRTRLVDTVTQLGAKPKKAKAATGDEDLPMRDTLGDRRDKYERGVTRKMAAKAREEEEEADREAARERRRPVDEDEEYEGAATLRDRKRAAKEEKYRRKAGIIARPEEEMGAADKRNVGKKIMDNRGLTPHRNKDHKNPRKRLRDKYAKAQIRRKGQVRSMREDGGGYAGEVTGIKTSVSKSRRFGK